MSTNLRVEGVPWGDFLPNFLQEWEPGQHVALVGPTGRGKTTTLTQIVGGRKKVLFIDPKGGDKTLRRAAKAGAFEIVKKWPPPARLKSRSWGDSWHGRAGDPPKPVHLIYSPPTKTMEEFRATPELYRAVLEQLFTEENWTIGIDEGRLAADYMNLKDEMTLLYIAARDKGTSVLTNIQAPRWVPREIMDQSQWIFAWPIRDRDTQGRIAEVLGEDRSFIREILETMGFHDVLVLDVPGDRLVITRPDKV